MDRDPAKVQYVLVAAELSRLSGQDGEDGLGPTAGSLKKSVRAENAEMKERIGDLKEQVEGLASLAHDFNLTPRTEELDMVSNGSLESAYRPELRKSHLADLLNAQLGLASQNNILISQRDLARSELLKLKEEVASLSTLLIREGTLDTANRTILLSNLDKLIQMKFSEKSSKLVQTSVSADTLSVEEAGMRRQIEIYQYEINQLKTSNDFETSRLKDELLAAQEIIGRKNQQLTTLEDLQSRSIDSNDISAELTKMILEREDLLDRVHEADTGRRRAANDCIDLQSRFDFLQKQSAKLQADKDEETQARRRLEIEVSSLKSDVERAYRELNAARAGRSLRTEFTEALATEGHAAGEVSGQSAEKRLEELMEELRVAKQQLERKSDLLENANRELADLKKASPLLERRGTLDARASFVGGQMDRARLEIEYQASKIKELEESLDDKSNQIEKKNTEIYGLKLELDRKATEIQKLLSKLDSENRIYLSDTEKVRSDLADLQKEYSDHKTIIVELNKQLDDYDSHITALEKKIAELSGLHETAKSDLDNSQARVKQLRSEVVAKEAEIEKWRLEARKAAAGAANTEDTSYADLLAKLKEKFAVEIKEAMDDNESLREKVRTRQIKINEMELELEQLAREKETVASLRKQLDRLTSELKASRVNTPQKLEESGDAREKLAEQSSKIDNLLQELEFQKAQAAISMSEAVNAAEETHKSKIKEINAERAEEAMRNKQQLDLLKKQIRELEDPLSTQQRSLREKQQEIADLTLQLSMVNSRAAEDMKSQEDEIQRLRSKLREFSLKNKIDTPVSPLKEQEAISDYINEIEDLRAKVDRLESDMERSNANLRAKDLELADLKSKIGRLAIDQRESSDVDASSLQSYKDKIVELRDRVKRLESDKMESEDDHARKVAILEESKERLDQEMRSYVRAQLETASRLAEMEKLNEGLAKRVDELTILVSDSESIRKKLNEYETKVRDLEARLAESDRQQIEGSDLVAKLSSQLELAADQNGLLEKSIRELRSAIEEKDQESSQKIKLAQRSLEAEQQEVQHLREQISSIKRLNGEEVEDLNGRLSSVTKKLSEANKAMADLETQLLAERRLKSEAQFQVETLERKVAALTREHDEIQSVSQQSEKEQFNIATKELTKLKQESQLLRDEKDTLTRKLVRKQEEVYELEEQLEQAKKKPQSLSRASSHDLDAAQSEISKLKRLVEHKESEIEELVEELNRRARKPKSAESESFDEIIKLKNRVKELEEELQEARLKASVPSKAEIERFQEHIEDLTQTNNQLLQKLKDKQNQMLKAIQEKDEEIEQLQRKLNESAAREQDLASELARIRNTIESIKVELGDDKLADIHVAESVKSLRDRLTKAESRYHILEADLNSQATVRKEDDSGVGKESKALRDMVKNLEKEKQELQKQLLTETSQRRQLQIRHQSAADSKEDTLGQASRLKSEVADLKSQLESAKARLTASQASLDIAERKLREKDRAILELMDDSKVCAIMSELKDQQITDSVLKMSLLPDAIRRYMRRVSNERDTLVDQMETFKAAAESKQTDGSLKMLIEENSRLKAHVKSVENKYEDILAEVKKLTADNEAVKEERNQNTSQRQSAGDTGNYDKLVIDDELIAELISTLPNDSQLSVYLRQYRQKVVDTPVADELWYAKLIAVIMSCG